MRYCEVSIKFEYILFLWICCYFYVFEVIKFCWCNLKLKLLCLIDSELTKDYVLDHVHLLSLFLSNYCA